MDSHRRVPLKEGLGGTFCQHPVKLLRILAALSDRHDETWLVVIVVMCVPWHYMDMVVPYILVTCGFVVLANCDAVATERFLQDYGQALRGREESGANDFWYRVNAFDVTHGEDQERSRIPGLLMQCQHRHNCVVAKQDQSFVFSTRDDVAERAAIACRLMRLRFVHFRSRDFCTAKRLT